MMLKLTMSPRKRQKRLRSFQAQQNWVDEATQKKGQKELLFDQLSTILFQEESPSYTCCDYLSMTAWQTDIYQLMEKRPNASKRMIDSRIDEFCREQICEWSYRVVDYFRIDREVVSLSLSYLDRFLSTCNCDRSMFKLAATTTLYMAVKIFHPHKLGDLGILSDLSRGEFEMKDVAEMEAHVLKALSWNLYPPTAVAFSSILLDYIFVDECVDVPSSEVADIHDLTSFFAELAVCDYFFVGLRQSTISVASILNALEGMFGQNHAMTVRLSNAVDRMQLPIERQELSAARNRLWQLYERSEECALHTEPAAEVEQPPPVFTKNPSTSNTISPVSVASESSQHYRPKSTTDFRPAPAFSAQALRNGSW
mmetsp:Transcript_9742/g.10754  ORF Transcript_9742/g.10754 Transcript_9742/m.10754 type:complete len:368 (+) Transcript_9742:93-1196(+)